MAPHECLDLWFPSSDHNPDQNHRRLHIKYKKFGDSDVPTVMVVKKPIFWDVTPSCSLVKINQYFRRMCPSSFRVEEYAKQETCFNLDWFILQP
jgi:hypothetical protein